MSERLTNSDYMENPDLLSELIYKIERSGSPEEREQLSRFLGSIGLYNVLEDNENIIRGED